MSTYSWFAHGAAHAAGSLIKPVTHSLSMVGNAALPLELPDESTLIDLYVRGWIDDLTFDKFSRLNGVYTDFSKQLPAPPGASASNSLADLWKTVVYARQELPTPEQFFVLTNRGLCPQDKLGYNLSLLGFSDPKVQQLMANLRYEVPGPADLVRFAVRHIFEPDLINYFGYPDERNKGPFLLDIYHQAAGINYPIFTGPLADTVRMVTGKDPAEFKAFYAAHNLPEPTWADAYWWTHWVLPSPGQGYEMLFRLRPDRLHQFDPPGTSTENFSLEDLGLLLRANDYPPFWRRKLAAIAYRIPGIRFLRQLVSTGVFGQEEVADLLLRQGYSPGDTNALVQTVFRNDRDQKRKEIERRAKGKIADYWELGIISDADYRNLLQQSGLSDVEATEVLDLAHVDYSYKRVGKVVNYVRRRYTSGAITREVAGDSLRQAGIVEPRIIDYLADWSLEIKTRGKEINAQKAIRWACDGIIGVGDLRQRLANLGYDAADIDGLVEEASQCAQARAARAAAAAARAQKATQRDLIAAQKAAANQIRSARRALAAHGSPAQLRKWYCEGHIGQPELYQRLSFLGWPDIDIGRLISDCKATQGQGRGGPRAP